MATFSNVSLKIHVPMNERAYVRYELCFASVNPGSLGSSTTSFLIRLLFAENGTSFASGPRSIASCMVQRPRYRWQKTSGAGPGGISSQRACRHRESPTPWARSASFCLAHCVSTQPAYVGLGNIEGEGLCQIVRCLLCGARGGDGLVCRGRVSIRYSGTRFSIRR